MPSLNFSPRENTSLGVARPSSRALCLVLLLFFASCTGADANKKKDDASAQKEEIDCGSTRVQRTLTYCVSPGAAEFARQNETMRMVMKKGDGAVTPDIFPLPVGSSPVLGPEDAAVTIVVFSDLECPYCAEAHAELELLQSQMPKDVRLVFKHFPLSFHPNAGDAARAASAMAEQGKFWEFVHVAYQRQDALGPRQYEAIVEQIGGDLAAYRATVDQQKHIEAVERDMRLGEQINVAGTPTIFFNGVALQGGFTAADLSPVVLQQKQIVDAFVAAGVPKKEIYWRMVRAQYQELPDAEPEQPDEPARELVYIPVGDSPVKGAAEDQALVTIVVFSDFECPYCKDANPAIEAVLGAHEDKVRLVFKHFPLPFHKRADNAAGAAVLAHRQGKFWELHDLLFANQQALSDADLQRYIEQVGIQGMDVNKKMQEDPSVAEAINADMVMGVEAGVNGTPTMFINGIKVMGGLEQADLEKMITEQLTLGEKLRNATGKSGEDLYEAIVEANATQAQN